MDDCIFCRIISSNAILKVYEDRWTVAFMDTAKDVDGHIDHLVDQCGYEGVNLLNASDESAGQSVPHFHIHIIPRKENDEIDAWPIFTGAKQELEIVFEKIRMENP